MFQSSIRFSSHLLEKLCKVTSQGQCIGLSLTGPQSRHRLVPVTFSAGLSCEGSPQVETNRQLSNLLVHQPVQSRYNWFDFFIPGLHTTRGY